MSSSYEPQYQQYETYDPEKYNQAQQQTAYKIHKTNEVLSDTWYFNKSYLDALQEQVAMQTNNVLDYELDHFWSQLDNLEQTQKNTLAKIQVSQGSGITAGNSKQLAVQRFLTKTDTDKANLETNFLNKLSSYADKQRKNVQDIYGREIMKWKEITTDMYSMEDYEFMMANAEYNDRVNFYQHQVNTYNNNIQQYNMAVQQQQADSSSLLGIGSLITGFFF